MPFAFTMLKTQSRQALSGVATGPRMGRRLTLDVARIRLFGLATAIVFIAYTSTLSVANAIGVTDAMIVGAANTLPTVLLGTAAYWIVSTWVMRGTRAVQIMTHLLLASCFAMLCYWLLLVMLGLAGGVSATQFEVRPFVSRAMAWQTLQNLTVYAVIAALGYRSDPGDNRRERSVPEETRDKLSRYFIRSGEDAIPVDIGSIVSISGADDYAEIRTVGGQHLARMTLAKFEELLDPAVFVRVHRSRIVNLDHIARIEPAGGGRLLVHMNDGGTVGASRSGSTLLRERIL